MLRRRAKLSHGLLIPLLLLSMLMAACGGGDPSSTKVAEIEDRVIMLDYFERKMNTISPDQLPADVTTHEGRMELLETIINKEVLALKAEELGFAEDGAADQQGKVVSEFKAAQTMREDITREAQTATEAEVQAYYQNLTRKLHTRYMLFDYMDDALEAKRLVEGGEDWKSVAMRLDGGDPGPDGDFSLSLLYGTIADDIEWAVFEQPVGVISDPIESIYGYFLIRVEGQTVERTEPLEALRPKVIASVTQQKAKMATLRFIDEVFEQYNFQLNDEALKIAWEGVPADVALTPPPPVETLEKIAIDPADYDKVLMSWDGEVWDLRRYADFFNESSVFGRPRQENHVGGMRRSLKEVAVRVLMLRAARDRGYTNRPEIRDEFKLRREQSMVTLLHEALVKDQVTVLPEHVDEYWAAHPGLLDRPELRGVFALVTEDESAALAAMVLAKNPATSWSALVSEHCADGPVKDRAGALGDFAANGPSVLSQIAFELQATGDVSYPRQIENGMWAIVRLGEIQPAYEPSLEEVRPKVGEIVKRTMEEELFLQRMEEWKSEFRIVRYEGNVDKAVFAPVAPQGQNTVTSSGGFSTP